MRGVWTLAFLVNFFLLGSVFDIYFKSPIVHVPNRHRSSFSASPRLLFIVADGLRADTFFLNPHLRPYLTSVLKRNEGVAVGISDTRVPTESRPGHIALFAGFYEDPSAVFTGWKNNLVEFDSVFNQSKGSIALGSPDVIDMFAQGEAKAKIYSETYSSDWQDFLESNSSVLDTWVFERFKNLVGQQKLPRHDNLIIFLHLLGIDNTGHATKPHSKEYKNGLLIVDGIVQKVERMMTEYYGDENTMFVFTADHGMTDWGSHGSGSIEETETPIIVWGPGIKKTEHLRINQADIASLVSGSLGIPFPSNSVGKFPTQIWSDLTLAYENLRANFLQILELTKTKRDRVMEERNFPLIRFPGEEMLMNTMLVDADKLAKAGNLKDAISQLDAAFEEALRANVYYERYNQQLMICFSVAIFILLMILVASGILSLEFSDRDLSRLSFVLDPKLFLWAFGLASIVTKGVIGWSLWKMGYCFVPNYLVLLLIYKFRQKIVVRQKVKLIWSLGLSIFGVQLLVLSFWERSVLSVVLILNLGWVLWSHSHKNRVVKGANLLLHLVAVGVLALFPAVPIIGRDRSIFFTSMGPLLSCAMVAFGLVFLGGAAALTNPCDQLVLATQLFLQATVGFLSHFPTFHGTRMFAWSSLLLSMICPTLISSKHVVLRLTSIFLALGTPFAFLGISYETLFFPVLFLVLLLFLKLEIDEQSGDESGRNWKDFFTFSRQEPVMGSNHMRSRKDEPINIHRSFRRAWLHLFFVLLSFFGTGNIGSVSSFDPSSTRCFVSVFSPWVMMILMLTKILAPFLLVSSFWRALLPSTRDVERNFGILLLLCQGMSLAMFFRVRNTGSWLEIGMSISHFVIVQVTTLFLLLFHFIANWLVTYELLGSSNLPTMKDN